MPNYQIIAPDNAGTTYDIYDDAARLITLDGRGIPNVIRRMRTSPGVEGAFDRGYILESRRMDLRIFYSESTSALADAKRDQLYEIFRPFDKPFSLKVTRDDSAVRQIDCNIEGIFDIPDSEIYGQNAQVISVRLVAPDPIWYDPTEQVVEWSLFGGSSGSNLGTLDGEYDGNWFERPEVRIYGEIDNPTIRLDVSGYSDPINQTAISYTLFGASGGVTVPDDHYWVFFLEPGDVRVQEWEVGFANGTDIMSSIGPNSSLADFSIWPEDLYTNTLSVSWAGTPNANSKLQLRFYNRYIGI